MQRSSPLAFGLLALVTACADVTPSAPTERPLAAPGTAVLSKAARPRAGHYIVVFRRHVRDTRGQARKLTAAHAGRMEFTYVNAIHGFAAALTPASAAALRYHPDVAAVEPDQVVSALTTQNGAPWGLDRIDQAGLPMDSRYSYGSTGSGVNAYILDTGIRTTHSEFGGRAVGSFTSINDGNGAGDCHGHGTHVAGTVGGSTYGVAKQVKLHAVRVLDCNGDGTVSSVIAGVDWVTANHVKPAVANMSLGGGVSAAMDEAVQSSIASGVTYAVAAGNSDVDACTTSPARAPAAITVGATTAGDWRAWFSNFGSCLDIFAPGEGVTSAYHGDDADSRVLNGTSMASPHVAGAAALFLETNTGATPDAVSAALLGNATTGVVTSAGSGSANRLLNVSFLASPTPAPNAAPVARFVWSCVDTTCSFDASGSSDDVAITSYAWTWGKSPYNAGSGMLATTGYPSAGPRTVTLTVTDAGGLTSTDVQTIAVGSPPPASVDAPPVARFTWSCESLRCSFDASGSTDDSGIAGYAWTWGKTPYNRGQGMTPSTGYPAPGARTVTLTVTDLSGQTHVDTQEIVVQ